MGPAVPLILLSVAVLALLLVAQLILLLLRKLRLFKGRLVSRVFFWGPLTIWLLGVAWIASSFILPSLKSPEATYQSIMGKPSDEEISILNSHASGGTDFQDAYVLFKTTDELLFQATLAATGFTPEESAYLPDFAVQGPEWWNVNACALRSVWTAKNLRGWDHLFVMRCLPNDEYYAMAVWIE